MSRSISRRIVVAGKEYYWSLNGNSIDQAKEQHIRVHIKKETKSILYIDPYQWHFEVTPKTIEQGITFATLEGWNPNRAKKTMYISMNNGEFYVLPEGIKFGYQDENNTVNKSFN